MALADLDLQPTVSPVRDRATADPGVAVLWGRVRAVRRRMIWMAGLEGGMWVAAVFVASAGLAMGLDLALEWPRWVRGLELALVVAGVAGTVWSRVIRPWRRIPDHDAMALLIERRQPRLGSRLISAVQLTRETASTPEAEAFVGRLVGDAGRWGGGIEPGALVPTEGARRLAWWVGPLMAVALGIFIIGWPVSGVLLRRAMLGEVALPRRTRIVEVTAPKVVGRGDDVRVAVRVEGVVPGVGQLLVRQSASGRVQQYPMDPEADGGGGGRFGRTLAGVPGSFRFRVRVNDAESDEYPVTVLPRPVVTNLVLTQILPGYTGMAPRRLQPGELSLLRGSRLRVEGESSQGLREAAVRLGGPDRVVPLAVDPAEPSRFAGEVVMDDGKIHGFSLELIDREGIPSRDPAVYALNVVEDAPPQVRVLVPARREELVTPRGTVLIAFEARDDFGLGHLRIRHQPASSTNAQPISIELDLAGETNAVVRRRFDWRLPTLQPPLVEGAMHEFWVEAVDRNDVFGAQTGRSERYLLRVVTEAEKRADLLGRAGDAIGRLGEVAQGQERLNESLGRIILSRPDSP